MPQAVSEAECTECDRTFTVEFSGDTAMYHTMTRFCPRCGAKL